MFFSARTIGFPPGPGAEEDEVYSVGASMPPGSSAPEMSLREQLGDALFSETWRRLRTGELQGASAVTYLERYYRNDAPTKVFLGALPSAWPSDRGFETLRWVLEGAPSQQPSATSAIYSSATYPSVGARTRFPDTSIKLAIDCSRSSRSFMDRARGREVDGAVRAAIDPVVAYLPEGFFVKVRNRCNTPAWQAVKCFLHYRVHVLLKGREVAHGSCFASRSQSNPTNWFGVGLEWDAGMRDAAASHPEQIELVFTGDPVAAVDEYIGGVIAFERTAWAGEFRFRPRVEGTAEAK